MRRYWLTIILLLALLIVGGLAVVNLLGTPSFTRGAYVPTLSSDPAAATVQGTILVVAIGAVLGAMISLGVFLAISFYRFTKLMAVHMAEVTAVPRSAAPKPSASDQGLAVPLSSNRSVIVFWVVIAALVIGSQILRYWGEPIGYLPGLSQLSQMPVFKLPGAHIDGLPAFVAGPGDTVTAAQLLVLVLAVAVGAVVVMGFGLARAFAKLDYTVSNPGKLPRTPFDQIIPMVEHQIEVLRSPRPRRLPGNPIDGLLIGLNAVLLLGIVAVVAFYVVPSFGGVAAIDASVEATKVASLVTPTAEATAGPSDLDALKAELAALPPGHPSDGKAVFNGAGGCFACHSLEPDKVLVGPSQVGVATRALTRKPGYPPDLYLYESIIRPNAFVAPNFAPNIMPPDFKQRLTPQQISDVIAFLMTLK